MAIAEMTKRRMAKAIAVFEWKITETEWHWSEPLRDKTTTEQNDYKAECLQFFNNLGKWLQLFQKSRKMAKTTEFSWLLFLKKL